MQKDWITTGNVACFGITGWWPLTQPVGSPVSFVQRVSVAGAGLGSLLPFARQLPVCVLGGPGPQHRQGPITSATDSSRRTTPHPLDELERAANRLRHCLPGDKPQHA